MSAANFLSSVTSLFGGTSDPPPRGGQRSASSSSFGSAYPPSFRRGPNLGGEDTWAMPYQPYSRAMDRNTSGGSSASSVYPPLGSRSANDSLANLASASTHTLVPPGRSSLAEARGSAGVSIPSTSFPPLRHTWQRIWSWSENNYFELKDTLNWPATEAQVEELEMTIGFALPGAVRDSYLCHNGQELESNQSCGDGIFFGLALLSLEQIAEEWKFWRAVDDDPTSGASSDVRRWQSSCPDKWVRPEYSCRGWIPLITDHVGNYIGIDMMPYPSGGGSPGQVIVFGRDFDTKVVLWRGEGEGGWGRFLQYVAEELENGEMWTLEDTSGGSDDEEDAIGYESYFSGGGAGAAKGGGDRGGMGAAGFRMAGEYKGWPVLEAWADRSMRCWEEVGLPSGMPIGQAEEAEQYHQEQQQAPGTPTVKLSGPEEREEGSSSGTQQASQPHPLQATQGLGLGMPSDGRPFSPSGESSATQYLSAQPNERRTSDTLSLPALSRKAERQKQKQRDFSGSSVAPVSREKRGPPPAPSQALDLPTIDDVRAVHAAALAERERSAQVQYTDLRGTTASMNSLSLGRNGTLRAGSRPAADDSLELDTRSSYDGSGRRIKDISLSGVVVHGEPRHSLGSPRQGNSPRVSGESRTTNFFDPAAPAVGRNLLDNNSMPNSPTQRLGALSPTGGGDYISSPLGGAAKGGTNGVLGRVLSPEPGQMAGPRSSTPHYEDSPYHANLQTA